MGFQKCYFLAIFAKFMAIITKTERFPKDKKEEYIPDPYLTCSHAGRVSHNHETRYEGTTNHNREY